MKRSRQLELALVPKPRWGGRRRGAGRKRGPRPAVAHVSRIAFDGATPGLVTLRVRGDVASLRSMRVVRALERAFAAGRERGEFRLVHYVVLGNYAHLIVEADSSEALARGMKSLAARFSRAVNGALGRTGPVLTGRYHLRVLSVPRQARHALAYVLLNARRHLGARAPAKGRIDPASSGRFLDGWVRRVEGAGVGDDGTEGDGDSGPAPVAKARTWLLRVGWRRHGMIDPGEVPGPATRGVRAATKARTPGRRPLG